MVQSSATIPNSVQSKSRKLMMRRIGLIGVSPTLLSAAAQASSAGLIHARSVPVFRSSRSGSLRTAAAPARFHSFRLTVLWARLHDSIRPNQELARMQLCRCLALSVRRRTGRCPHRAHFHWAESQAPFAAAGCWRGGAAFPRKPRRLGRRSAPQTSSCCRSARARRPPVQDCVVGVTPTNHTLGFVIPSFGGLVQSFVAHDLCGARLAAEVDAFQVFASGGVEGAGLRHLGHAVGDGHPVLRIDGNVHLARTRQAINQILRESPSGS